MSGTDHGHHVASVQKDSGGVLVEEARLPVGPAEGRGTACGQGEAGADRTVHAGVGEAWREMGGSRCVGGWRLD